jgi:TonB family protein
MLDSVMAHAALLGLLYAVSIWPEPGAHLADPFTRRAMDAYSLSQFLPELHGAPIRRRAQTSSHGKPEPALARQEILSLPENPESLRQTVVAPPRVRLEHDLELPNIVAYEPAIPVQPIAASERDAAKLRLPEFMPEVIAPAADTSGLRSRMRLPEFEPRVIGPAPDVANANSRRTLPAFQPRVVEPAPDLGHISRGTGTNFAQLAPRVAEPVPEAPYVGDAVHASGQFIALNLRPAEVHGPLELPSGNRRGEFAASPGGHPEASGRPGGAADHGAQESKGPFNAPAGITVSATPAPAAPVATSSKAAPVAAGQRMAAMRPPAMSMPPHQPLARESTEPRSELEERIFGGRRSYTLSVNMPNLNTATGSWIIHFVERDAERSADRNPDRKPDGSLAAHGTERAPIAAPEVVSKADPVYPGDLMHDGVQGTVILTATIRADGSVSNIAIAKSLDPRLDRNAAQALSRWLFRPALKNGQAIDLEAVITVPFRARAAGF